jgi:phage tail-like protein
MVKFSVNATRYDPFKNFKFRIKWDGKYVAGLSKMSALKRTTEVIEWREGGDPSYIHKMPGRTRYEPITLESGLTHDTAFEAWANLVFTYGAGAGGEMSLKKFRKDVIIDVFNDRKLASKCSCKLKSTGHLDRTIPAFGN